MLPHQLFDKKYLDKNKFKYILWEHPHYFKAYKYNQKKIILHKGSMEYYHDYLKKHGFKVQYFTFKQRPKLNEYVMFDPVDRIKLPGKYEILDSPNFIMTLDHYEQYQEKTDKFVFYNFYMWCKKQIDVLPGVKSKDKENRKPMPKGVKSPGLPSNKADEKYIKHGVQYAKKHFKNNYGNTDEFMFPLTHTTARRWVSHFIRNKVKNFGSYQDAIREEDGFLFHSLLSTSINIGLLNPMEVIKEMLEHKKSIPMNSLEGFIRQLFWREYQRYTYMYYDFKGKNYFGNRKKLSKAWYDGTLGIEPVDVCIQGGFDTGYLHHIERLMVMGNFMNLSGIAPKEGFRWFMEFSCDSYEWVMHQNVYDMVFFVSGGATMRKPYISSSNYILKMSDYEKGDWSEKWTEMYHAFLKKHRKKMLRFRYYFRSL